MSKINGMNVDGGLYFSKLSKKLGLTKKGEYTYCKDVNSPNIKSALDKVSPVEQEKPVEKPTGLSIILNEVFGKKNNDV